MHINKCKKKTTHGFWVCRRQFETCDILQTTDRMQNIFSAIQCCWVELATVPFLSTEQRCLSLFVLPACGFRMYIFIFLRNFCSWGSNLAFFSNFFMRIRTTIFQVSDVNSFFLRLCLLSVYGRACDVGFKNNHLL